MSAAGPAGARAGHSPGADGHGLLVGAGKREGIFILLKITYMHDYFCYKVLLRLITFPHWQN